MATATVEETEPKSKVVDYFGLRTYGVTIGTEIMAGVTTFLTMSYIAFVNPGILSSVPDSTGFKLDFNATVTATCLAASIMCIIMGLYARRPFAMAPGMGLNAVVTYQLVASQHLTWPQAMTLIILEGVIITILVLTKFRQAIMDAVPMNLKKAIAAGIGLFLLYIGLNEGGLVAGNPTYAKDPTVPPVALGNIASWPVLVTVAGVVITLILYILGNRGAILIGILGATVIAIILNAIFSIYDPKLGWAVLPSAVVNVPTMPHFLGFDLGAFSKSPVSASLNTFAIMLSDFFDTMGTFVGLSLLAGFMVPRVRVTEKIEPRTGTVQRVEESDPNDLVLPDIGKPLLVDSIGPIVGGALGASSSTTYIESGSGISAGGRTGITVITVGVLFLLVPFFTPIIAIVPQQATAAALIVVGALMFSSIKDIEWDFATLFPVLVTLITMPLTYSITNGIGFGFLTFTLIALFTHGWRKVHPLMYVVSVAFLIYFSEPLIMAWFGIS